MIRQLVALLLASLFLNLATFPIVGSATSADGPVLSQPLVTAWKYQTNEMTDLTPATDGSEIFLPLTAGVLVSLNVSDGKLRWKAEIGGDFSAAPVADEHAVYIATSYAGPEQKVVHGTLRALSKATGITLWVRTLSSPLDGALAVSESGLFGAASDGQVFAFNKSSGLVQWRNQYPEKFTGNASVSGSRFYIGSNSGVIRALDVKTGQLLWQYKTAAALKGPIAVKDGLVYFGSADGNVYAFSEVRLKRIWHRRTGAAVEAVALTADGVIVSSLDNFAYLLSRDGTLIWRRQLPGRITSRPLISTDGALFTPFSSDAAVVLNLNDGKPINTLNLGEENTSAAAPIVVRNLVIISTPHALAAFGAPPEK